MITDEVIVDYVNTCKKEAESARKGIQQGWDELWQLYQNRQDFSKKADWQSKCSIPKLATAIEKASAIVKKGLVGSPSYFTVESLLYPEKILLTKDLIDLYLKKANFIPKFVEATTIGLILGIASQKFWWEEALKIKNVDPYNLFLDPEAKSFDFSDSRYVIERVEEDLGVLKNRIKDPELKKYWNVETIDKIDQDYRRMDLEAKERLRRGMSSPSGNKYHKKVELLEFWGNLVDEDGNIVEEKQLVVIANGKYVARHQDNPFWHKNPPYVLNLPKPYPFRLIGKSMIGNSARMQYTLNNIINLQVDNLNYAINKLFRADLPTIGNIETLMNIYPGKVINAPSGAFEALRVGDIPMGSFAELNFFDREIQNSTAVTEFLMGLPTAKGRPTKGEVVAKTAEGHSHFDSIAYDIEKQTMGKIIEMVHALIIQFAFIEPVDPALAKLCEKHGNMITALSEKERRDLATGDFTFKGSGISLMLAQDEKLQKLFMLLRFTEDPKIAQKYDRLKIIDKIIELLGVGNVEDFKVTAPPMPEMPPAGLPGAMMGMGGLPEMGR